MNNPSPLVPQGTQRPGGKSNLYFKVIMILAIHVVVIGGMLLQGCKDTSKDQTKDPSITQAGGDSSLPSNSVASTEPAVPAVNPMVMSNQAMSTMPSSQNPSVQVMPGPAVATMPGVTATISTPMTSAMPVAATDGKDYAIAKGDTFGAIARRNSISIKVLMDANPGVNPRKLKVGQKIQIPASTGSIASTGSSSSSGAGAASADMTSDGSTYVVKSGDTLGKIARSHGTSYKKIMAMNDLKTTAIRVGQKLKMPAPKPIGAEPMPASAALTPTTGPVSAVSTGTAPVAN